MNVKEESGKVGLKLSMHKTKIMASSPITSWQIDGVTMETVQTLFWGAPKSLQMVTTGHEMKRRFLLGRKAMKNLDRVLKSSNITLPTKVSLVKAMVFPVVMDGCESWTICWRRLLGAPWTARRSNQSSLKDVNPEYSLVGLILKLKL